MFHVKRFFGMKDAIYKRSRQLCRGKNGGAKMDIYEKGGCIKCNAKAIQGSTMCQECRECFDFHPLVDGHVERGLLEERIKSLKQAVDDRQKFINYLGEVSFLQQASIIMINKKLREVYGVKGGSL